MVDLARGHTASADTQAEIREMACDLYPGAMFVLTTLENLFGDSQRGPHDLVVMAVCVLDGLPLIEFASGQMPVVAYICGPVHGPHCVPFAPGAWPQAKNYLRRPTPVAAEFDLASGKSLDGPATRRHPGRKEIRDVDIQLAKRDR